ncbi:ribonuclease R, partial [Halobellus sp. Atlit-38R]
MSDDEPKPGSAEDQGPVTITPALADRLAEKREELFEEFGIRDEFPSEVLREAEARTEGVYEEIEAEIDEREDL